MVAGTSATSAKSVATKLGLCRPPSGRRVTLKSKRCWRNAQRSIVRVARITVAKLAIKAKQASPPLPRLRPKKSQRKQWEVLELDEM